MAAPATSSKIVYVLEEDDEFDEFEIESALRRRRSAICALPFAAERSVYPAARYLSLYVTLCV